MERNGVSGPHQTKPSPNKLLEFQLYESCCLTPFKYVLLLAPTHFNIHHNQEIPFAK